MNSATAAKRRMESIHIEFFDDDHPGEQAEVMVHRYLAGLNYWLTDHVALSVEYRHSRYEEESDSETTDHQNEV